MFFSNSRIYQQGLELVSLCKTVVGRFPTGYAFLSDQIKRSSASVVLNFAEGCGKTSSRDRKRFFMIARGSVYETAAALEVAERLEIVDTKLHAEGMRICDQLGAMLTKYR
jgi:four helix bundle protein